MLLTLSAPAKSEFEFKSPHDFSLPLVSTPKRQSPPPYAVTNTHRPAPLADVARGSMSTPHRGLPPPAAMTLPDLQRAPPPITSSLGQMPAPPSQWQGAEDSMRNWLAAKAEEDKRKQEEEKTRQETLRLEQRKIESNMLRDSMAGGVPPHMVPIIFAGIGGASSSNGSSEWLQQYAAQIQASQQQVIATQASPDARRDSRLSAQAPYASAPAAAPPPPAAVLHGQPPGAHPYSPTAASLSPQIGSRPLYAQGPTSAPRTSGPSVLPRLTTNEIQIAQPPTLQAGPTQDATASSPSIYFHHWVPPTSQTGSGSGSKERPATPTDYTSSPKKRKDTRAHQPAPAPTPAPQSQTSPSFNQGSSANSTPSVAGGRERHSRNRSDVSAGPIASSGPGRATPPLSGRSESFDRRARTASDSAGSRGSRDERPKFSTSSMPPSPRSKAERS